MNCMIQKKYYLFFFCFKIPSLKPSTRLSSGKPLQKNQKLKPIVIQSASSEFKTRGRKPMNYNNLKERSQQSHAQNLARNHCLGALLRAAETAAYKNGSSATKSILKLLRKNNEAWAKQALLRLLNPEKEQLSAEKCLMLKTTIRLSKRKYTDIATFMKKELGQRFIPWKDIIDYRNSIIPIIKKPNESKGYLSAQVTIRDMLKADVKRIMDLEDIRAKLDAKTVEGSVECVMHVSAGPDSATGFSHYNQAKFLAHDDSLFTEHYMSMRLETSNQTLYIVPNPQSDTFCRVRTMCWTKETDDLTREMYNKFFEEIDEINLDPVHVEIDNVTLQVRAKAIYSMIDGKAANAIVGNRNTHGCPLCPPYYGINKMIGPSFFHSRLNAVEWLMRNAAKKAVPGNPAQTHPEVRKEARSQADELEQYFNMNINRPKIGGCGSSNNGNMARKLLENSEQFASTLNINAGLVKNLKIISSLALSSRKLKSGKVKELWEILSKQIFDEFPFIKKLPPCIHKYSHLAEFVDKLVRFSVCYKINYYIFYYISIL